MVLSVFILLLLQCPPSRHGFCAILVGLMVLLLLLLVIGTVKSLRRRVWKHHFLTETSDKTADGKTEAPTITERERQILQLIAAGKTGPQIAEELFLSPETIKWYRKKLLARFNVSNTAELIYKAKVLNLI